MTQARERSATLSELVAEEIRALMARRRMSGRQLAAKLGVSPSWVSYRLTGTQPIDVNDMHRMAGALDVGIHDLLPPPEVAASAVVPSSSSEGMGYRRRRGREDEPGDVTSAYRSVTERAVTQRGRPRDNRPSGHPATTGVRRSSLLPRPPYGRAA